jgi:hypothetical protein
MNQAVQATQTDNLGLHAVPLPGRVVIDGKLDDWDLSGQVLMTYDIETLKDIYSAQVATMYDAENFYVSLHWKDSIPLGNSHDPRYTAGKAWAGDSVQLRLKTDRISHITAWYYAPKKEPGMTIAYGKSLTEPFDGGEIQLFGTGGSKMTQGAEMDFTKDADGKGYVQEIKIPWKLITQDKKYAPGDSFSMGLELLWGEADWPVHRYADNLQPGATSREFFWTAHQSWGSVTLEPRGNLKLPEPAYTAAYRKAVQGQSTQGPVEIAYNLPKDARVSLVINDASGKRIRNLVPALPRVKGRNVEKWDGLDDEGNPVAPGEYFYKAIYHDGIHANWTMSFANPGNPTWDTSDGRGAFYADHTAPSAAAAAGDYVALGAQGAESGKYLIGTNLEGQRLWGLPNRGAFFAGQLSLATDGKVLWVAQSSTGTIYRVELATGKYAPWKRTAKDEGGNEYQVLDLSITKKAESEHGTEHNLTSIAYRNGILAACIKAENKVKLLDSETGDIRAELNINAPEAITFATDGKMVVPSENRLVVLSTDGKTTAFNNATYEGRSLATGADGNIYLSVRGSEQNVKVFDATGKLLREIGKRGGRPLVGAYDANGMRNPAGIVVDSKNRLWVTEETSNPKRTSVWDATTGRLIKDLPGTTTYAGAGAINPDDPTMGFSDDTVYEINLQTGTWSPVYSLGNRDSADDIFPTRARAVNRVVTRGVNTYLFTADRTGGVRCSVLHNGEWRAGAFVGTVRRENDPEVDTNFTHPYLKDHVGEMVAWADRSGDGLVQPAELSFSTPTLDGKAVVLPSFYWGTLPDPDGTISYVAQGSNALFKFPITGTTPNGAPIYNLAQPQIVRVENSVALGNNGAMLMGGKEGRVYINQDPLTAVDAKGKVLFTYPSHHVSVHGSHTAKASRPGYIIGPNSILGTADMGNEIGEVFYLNGNLGENYLFTHDGLYIQTLFKDTRGYFDMPSQAVKGMSMDAITAGGESFGGNFVKTPDGKTYVTLGNTDARIMEVTGLNTIKRLSGKFSYTPAQYAVAQTLMQQNLVQANAPREYSVARAAAPATIDGKADEWPELLDDNAKILEIQDSPQTRFGRVAMRYDANNLYLGYRVFSNRGTMVNAGQDMRLLFKTGDAVDLMIGPGRENAGAAVAGDTRILMTMFGKETIAMLNQKVAPGAPATEKFGFSSPWRTITFDRVTEATTAKVATSGINGGYFVEAAIPWSTLGLTPKSGLELRGDVGVLFADNGGTTTISRQYWSNKATGLVNDVPGEADLTPGLWGTFTLE